MHVLYSQHLTKLLKSLMKSFFHFFTAFSNWKNNWYKVVITRFCKYYLFKSTLSLVFLKNIIYQYPYQIFIRKNTFRMTLKSINAYTQVLGDRDRQHKLSLYLMLTWKHISKMYFIKYDWIYRPGSHKLYSWCCVFLKWYNSVPFWNLY